MKAASFLAFGLIAMLFIAGCGKTEPQAGANAAAKVFKYPLVTSPTTLDPGKVQDGDTIDAVQQVFEGLVGWSPDNKPEGRLAEKWEIQDGGKTYLFTLRPGIKFTSGREVKAKDFKDCFERACDPAFASPTAPTYLSDIVGVKERLAGKAKEVTGYQAVGENQVKITLDKPRPYFLGKLTYLVAAVYDLSKIPDPMKEMAKTTEMVGTGPFIFDQFVPEQLLTFKANKDYYLGAPKIEGIERPIVKDAATRLNLYKSGDVDLVMLERQDIEGIKKDPKLKDDLKLFPRPSMWYLGMNLGVYPELKKVGVRQAIAQAIDIDDIIENVLGGANEKATGIVPPGVFGHRTDAKVWKYNPEAARKALADAGYPNGKGFPTLELSFREARPDIQLVAQKIATDLKKNLNITANLRTMEWRAYLEKHNKKEMPFFHMRWGADYLDAENFLSTLLAGYGPENKVNYENPEYDALCAKADSTLDEAERLKLYAQAEDIVLRDAPFVPIYFQRDAELIRSSVKGLRESVFGHLPHTTVEIVDTK